MVLEFDAIIIRNKDMDAAYIKVPYDIKELFGKGRLLVNATFDGYPYSGQVVKMGTPYYIIGVTKDIRKQINKSFGDSISVTLKERQLKNIYMREIMKKIILLVILVTLLSACGSINNNENSSKDIEITNSSTLTSVDSKQINNNSSQNKNSKFLFQKNGNVFEYENLKSNFTEVKIGSKKIEGNDKEFLFNKLNNIKLSPSEIDFNSEGALEINFSKENSSSSIRIKIDKNNIIETNNFAESELTRKTFKLIDNNLTYQDVLNIYNKR